MKFKALFALVFGLWYMPSYALTTTCPSSIEEFNWEFLPGDVIRFHWHVETINMNKLYVRTVGNVVEVFLSGGSFGIPSPGPQFYDATGFLPTPANGTYQVQIMPFLPVFGAPPPLITCPDPFFLPLVVGPSGTAVAVPTPASSGFVNALLAMLMVGGAGLYFRRRLGSWRNG